LAGLEAGKVAESVPNFEACKVKLDEEVAYYTKEGKL
jgi:hypothetical protein